MSSEMADSSALTLWDGSGDTLSLALLSDRQVDRGDAVGPGRLLHQAYSVAGRVVEKRLGRAAHEIGLGPDATSCRIEKAFGDDASTRQSRLDITYDSFQTRTITQHGGFVRALAKDCRKLLEYALPSQSPATQIRSFKSIILLTMRYPALRRMFLQSPDISKVGGSPDAICALWRSTECSYDAKERFTLEFAAHCLAKIDPNIELEGIRPSELGCISEECLGVVDRLLVRYCNEGSGFPRLIAIRYLAGILGLPSFWLEAYHVQKHTMDKLCRQTLRLIEDVNPDSVNAKDMDKLASLDPDGVDALAGAILVGGKNWIQREPPIKGLGSDHWLPNFIKLIKDLRGLILPDLLPIASQRAEENWGDLLKDFTTDQSPMSELDCHFEDTFVDGPPRSNWKPSGESSKRGPGVFVNGPPRFKWQPSNVADESPIHSDDGVPVTFRSYSSRSRLSRFLPGRGEASQSDWSPSDVADELLIHTDAGSPSLLKTITAAFRATFSRTASNFKEEATPSSLTGEDSVGENHHPETTPDTVNGTLAEQTEEDSIPNQPSSVIDVTATPVLGPAASNVQEQSTPSDPLIADESGRENNDLPETPDASERMLAEEPSLPAEVGNSIDGTLESKLSRVVDAPVGDLGDKDTSNTRPLNDGGVNVLSHGPIPGLAGEVSREIKRRTKNRRRDEFRGDITGFIDIARNRGDVIAYSEPIYRGDAESQVPRFKRRTRIDEEDASEEDSDSSDDDGSGGAVFYGEISGFVKEARGSGNAIAMKKVTYIGNRESSLMDSRGAIPLQTRVTSPMESRNIIRDSNREPVRIRANNFPRTTERQQAQNRAEPYFDTEALTKEIQNMSPEMQRFVNSVVRQGRSIDVER